MMKTEKRLEKIEQQIPEKKEPHFYYWIGDPWTEEQKAEAIRKHPEQTIFWRSLRETLIKQKAQESASQDNPV